MSINFTAKSVYFEYVSLFGCFLGLFGRFLGPQGGSVGTSKNNSFYKVLELAGVLRESKKTKQLNDASSLF